MFFESTTSKFKIVISGFSTISNFLIASQSLKSITETEVTELTEVCKYVLCYVLSYWEWWAFGNWEKRNCDVGTLGMRFFLIDVLGQTVRPAESSDCQNRMSRKYV